jgi:hypothetical protein
MQATTATKTYPKTLCPVDTLNELRAILAQISLLDADQDDELLTGLSSSDVTAIARAAAVLRTASTWVTPSTTAAPSEHAIGTFESFGRR